jgi:hypothetical protein
MLSKSSVNIFEKQSSALMYRVNQKEVYTLKNLFKKTTDAKSMYCVRMERSLKALI